MRQALELNPSYADAYAMLSWLHINKGELDTGLDYINRALKLNPGGGSLYQMQLGRLYYFKGNMQQAVVYFEKARQANPVYIDTLLYLSATYINLGHHEEAGWILSEAMQANPELHFQDWLENFGFQNESYKDKLNTDLKKAEKYLPN